MCYGTNEKYTRGVFFWFCRISLASNILKKYLNIRKHLCVLYLVSLLMVGMTAAVVGAVAFFWASSLRSWLISGEE